ncbi:MAG: hypothetical protein UY04_C0064G0008, partial [Parcubacteria group bacterium GW2011_GWA2_47_7]
RGGRGVDPGRAVIEKQVAVCSCCDGGVGERVEGGDAAATKTRAIHRDAAAGEVEAVPECGGCRCTSDVEIGCSNSGTEGRSGVSDDGRCCGAVGGREEC